MLSHQGSLGNQAETRSPSLQLPGFLRQNGQQWYLSPADSPGPSLWSAVVTGWRTREGPGELLPALQAPGDVLNCNSGRQLRSHKGGEKKRRKRERKDKPIRDRHVKEYKGSQEQYIVLIKVSWLIVRWCYKFGVQKQQSQEEPE